MKLTLKQARLLKGYKQIEISAHLGVHVQTYRKIERYPDTATIGEAKKICDFLGISYDYIFFDHDSTLGRYDDELVTT